MTPRVDRRAPGRWPRTGRPRDPPDPRPRALVGGGGPGARRRLRARGDLGALRPARLDRRRSGGRQPVSPCRSCSRQPGVARAWLFVAGRPRLECGRQRLRRAPALVALCFGVANAAEVAVVHGLLTRGGRRPALASMEDLWHLIAATLAGAARHRAVRRAHRAHVLGGHFLDAASAVGVLARRRRARHRSPRHRGRHRVAPAARASRTSSSGSSSSGVTTWVFNPGQSLPLAFLPIPGLVWGALRLGLRTGRDPAARRRCRWPSR